MGKNATNVAESHFTKICRSKQNKTSKSKLYHIQNEDFSDGFLIMDSIQKHFPKLFNGLGCIPGEHNIELKEGSVPEVETGRKHPFGIY